MCPKVTEAYKETVRDEILKAAERVFAKRGYHAASMDDIVHESGLSKGAIYGYFRGKEELFLALEARQDELTPEQYFASMPPGSSAMARLATVGELVVRHQARMNRDACRLGFEFWTEAPRLKTVQRIYKDRQRTTHDLLAGLIREGVKSGEFRKDIDPDALATFLMGAVDGATLYWATIGIDLDWEALLKTIVGVVEHGVLNPGRRAD